MTTNTTKRVIAQAAEDLLLVEHPVLDKGFVRLVDYMGSDQRVVQAARVSYGAGTKTVNEDRGLINYLVKNAHTSPLEMVKATFHIKMPLFVFAQHIRHRMANVNAQSARYSVMKDEFYIPQAEQFRKQDSKNRQATFDPTDASNAQRAADALVKFASDSYAEYEAMLNGYGAGEEKGIARELARMILPQNLYTEFYWTIDLHNGFHYCRLRLDWHAQYEIRQYAKDVAGAFQAIAPMSWEAFEEHILYGRRLSRTETALTRKVFERAGDIKNIAENLGMTGKQVEEFLGKIAMMEDLL